jgi:TonB family protein
MKAAHVSHQLGHASQSLFATSLGASVIVHGLVITWMLSGHGPSRAFLTDLPAFHSVSLVNAPGSTPPAEPVASVPEPEPQTIPEPAAVPEAVNPAAVRNVVPETAVQPPQAKQATEVPEAAVEPPAPVAKPKPMEVPEKPSVVETRVQQPKPVKATEKRPTPAPTPTSAGSPTPSPGEPAAVQPRTAPTPSVAAAPREPASRNSPQAAARARDAIENLRAQSDAQEAGTEQSPGGIAVGMQELLLRTYKQRVRARIINAWHLPIPGKIAQGLQAVVLLTIDREGQVIRYELTRSSNNPSFDASLHRAVQASSPLPELPETFEGEILEAEIYFTPPASS